MLNFKFATGMKSNLDYEAPSAQVLVMEIEGVICGSYRDMNFGDSNQSGTISDDDIFDGGSF